MKASAKVKNPAKMVALTLYVVNETASCRAARANLEKLCKEVLASKCHLEVVDLLEDPERARKDQVVAIPTLVRHHPPPAKRVVGDLSRTDRVLAMLNLHPRADRQPGGGSLSAQTLRPS